MEDLLGNDIDLGSFIIYPDGAKYKTGVVKKIGKTIQIAGVLKERWYGDDQIINKRKAPHLCVSISLAQLRNHERKEFLRTHPNGERTKIIGEGRETITLDNFVSDRIKMLIQLQAMIQDPNDYEFHLRDFNHPGDEEYLPTEIELENLSHILKR